MNVANGMPTEAIAQIAALYDGAKLALGIIIALVAVHYFWKVLP